MKLTKTLLLTALAGSLTFFTSCDSDDSGSPSRADIENAFNNANQGSSQNTADCLEGRTLCIEGTQTSRGVDSDPRVGTITIDTSFELEIDFFAGGVTNTNGRLTIDRASSSVVGNVPIPSNESVENIVNEPGTYDCDEELDGELTATIEEDGITTTYTLDFTSENAGTFVTTSSGNVDGITIDSNSSGTFELK